MYNVGMQDNNMQTFLILINSCYNNNICQYIYIYMCMHSPSKTGQFIDFHRQHVIFDMSEFNSDIK